MVATGVERGKSWFSGCGSTVPAGVFLEGKIWGRSAVLGKCNLLHFWSSWQSSWYQSVRHTPPSPRRSLEHRPARPSCIPKHPFHGSKEVVWVVWVTIK